MRGQPRRRARLRARFDRGAIFAGACACACLLGAGCATTRSPGDPLVEAPSSNEQAQALARVSWQVLEARGNELASAGDYTRAEQYLWGALQRGGPSERILPRLLRVCISGQRYRAATEYARTYLEAHPDAWALRHLVATIYIGLGEPHSARAHLELVLVHNPRHAESEYQLGALLRDDLRDLAAADLHFRRYLELAPEGEHAAQARAGLLSHVQPQTLGEARP